MNSPHCRAEMSTSTTIRWGTHPPIDLALDDDAQVFAGGEEGEENAALEVKDAASAVQSALAAPVDFPSFSEATVEGDTVAVALGANLPQLEELVTGLLAGLDSAGVAMGSVTFVVATRRDLESAEQAIADSGATVVLHDPTDEQQLCYVGEMQGDVTLRLSRVLFEADVVLPVGCGQPTSPLASVFDCLFPLFGDAESQRRYSSADESIAREIVQRRTEAGWLLGAPLLMQVIPGRGQNIAAVVVGTPECCQKESQRLADSIWERQFPRAARLVIATIAGPQPATWQQFAEAIVKADLLRIDGGAIALCMELPQRLGKSLRRLQSATDINRVFHQIGRDHASDTSAATALMEALERGPVYLLSNLTAEVVEDLGMAPIADGDELNRLAQRMGDCIILDDVQFTRASIKQVATVPGDLE